ncbi:MAG: hypothetical protein ACO1N9_03285 [Flavobacterium sp.]
MKRLLLLLLFCSAYAFAQNDSIQAQERIASQNYRARDTRFMTDIRVIYILPDGVGNNFLAKGNDGVNGFGLRFGIFKVRNLLFAMGGDLLFYDTTNAAYGGDTSGIWLNTGCLEIMYKIPVTPKLSVIPKIAPGYTFIHFNKSGDDGTQEGFRIGAGAYIDYKLLRWLAVFAGGEYSISYPQVNTNAAYENFFGKVEQLNFSAGVKFTLKD